MVVPIADFEDRFQKTKNEEFYKQDPKLKKEDVQALREWAKLQPHLPEVLEIQLILFLHSCYYSLELAKVTMDNYFTCKTLWPDFFDCLSESQLKQTMATGFSTIFPEKTSEGYSVILGKLVDCNPDDYNFPNQCNYADLIIGMDFNCNGLNNGLIIVLDAAGLTFTHMTKFGVFALKKYMFYIQEAVPIRIKGIHYINISPLAEKVFNLMKPFLKKDLLQIIHFHQGINGVFEFVPQRLFPSDYGGEGSSIAALTKKNEKMVLDNMEMFKTLETQKVDESKRHEKSKTESDVFGVDGSFKKLEVD